MIEEAKNQKEHYFYTILISSLAILAWKCSVAGVEFSYWEVFVPFAVGVLTTSVSAYFKYSPKNSHTIKHKKFRFNPDRVNPVSLGFQSVCVFWLIILLRKARVFIEPEVEQLVVTAFIVGFVIALCMDALDFINQRIHNTMNK